MQAIINGEMYEVEPAVKAYIKGLQAENEELKKDVDTLDQMCFDLMNKVDELKAENARLEKGYQKSIGVIAATDCVECKRHYEGEIKVRCWENREKDKLIDELNTELSGHRQNAIVFKPELMYTLKECEPKPEEWHNENPTYQNLQEIRYRAAKAEYDKIMKVLNGWGIKTMWWNRGAKMDGESE